MVKSRMEGVGVRVEMSTLNPTVSLADALDSAATRGMLYCIIITSQHEVHRSVTLTILHGRNPQGEWLLVRTLLNEKSFLYVCSINFDQGQFVEYT